MKTLEIQQTSLEKNKKLIKKLYKLLPRDTYFHFLYEPKLIIRCEVKIAREYFIPYLTQKGLTYKFYAYPSGRPYGEAKKGIVMKHLYYFLMLLWKNSQLAVTRNKEDDMAIIERYNHIFLNTFGYEWEQEVWINLQLAYDRLGALKKYELKALDINRLICIVCMWQIKMTMNFVQSLYRN